MMVLSQQDPRSVFGPQSITQLDSNITYLKEGFIFSSKAFLKNIQLMFGVMGNEFTLYLDGTYKITNEGWVLLVLGTHSVTIGQRVTHSLRPFMLCWTYSENAVAVTALLKCLKRTALQMFGIVGLHIAVVSIDHCEAFYNAITDDGTNDTMVVDCYAHMIRNIRDNNGNHSLCIITRPSICTWSCNFVSDSCTQYMCQIQQHEAIAGELVVFNVMRN